ncbi:hypothetical protein VTJ49DRAFT_4632 [Mycothermus thermophilus]|uniref:Non-homologous end-joining factor 1 n=1 Tax=Humicola insolens TaxID=85995 RepID=A0ABR3V4W0_HUMIN
MSRHASWRLLPATAPGVPTLLVSAAFAHESYTIHLSDLANLWVETMDRRPIMKRGMVEDTSIDPSDGPDQIRKMLELLRAAFDSSDPEHTTTSLALSRGDDDDTLAVTVTCVLPKPLKPFKWPMQFKKCPPSALASELVLPMLQAHEARLRDVEQLVSLIRDKDNVIGKLVDKLEASGIGLEHVFHALSGKRKVTRTAAEGRVKGIAPFSESDFKKKAELRSVAQPEDVTSLLGSAFGASGLQYKSDLDIEASSVLNDWWTKLGRGRNLPLSERPEQPETRKTPTPSAPERNNDEEDFQVQSTPPGARSARKRPSPTPAVDDDDTASDNDFQVQKTPPRARSVRKPANPPPSAADDDDTASEGDDAKASSPSPEKPRSAAPKLGAIGRRTSPRGPAASQRSGSSRTAAADTASETASDADDDDDDDLEKSPPPPKPAARRGGLGRIGGQPKRSSPPPAAESARPSSPAAAPAAPKESSPLPRRHKLGMIGKAGAGAAGDSPSTRDDGRGRSRTPATEQPKAPPARETSQERAERKRAELQREIEKRAAAGPAKKKRKF